MSDTAIYDAIVFPAAAAAGIPAAWVKAVIGAESSFNPAVPDRYEAGLGESSIGPMQLLVSTARDMGFTGTANELRQPAVNIPLGARYLAWIRDRWQTSDFRAVYSAYNSGRPDLWEISSEVRRNVDRALVWLAQFELAPAGGLVAAAAVGGLVWWISQRR